MSQENERIVLILPGDMLEDIDNLKWITKMGRQDVIRQAISEYIDRHAAELGKEPTLEEYMELELIRTQLSKELEKAGCASAVTCLRKCGIISARQRQILIGCPNEMLKGLMERIYLRKIQKAVDKILGRHVQIFFKLAKVDPVDESKNWIARYAR